jgi:hypothetical protein
MIRRTTWIFLGMFIVVLAAAMIFQKVQQRIVSAQPTSTSAYQTLLDTSKDQISALVIDDHQGHVITLTRDKNGNYTPSPDTTGLLTSDVVNSAMLDASGISTLATLNPVPSAEELGLTKPKATVQITLESGKKHTLIIGNLTPTSSGYYVQLDSEPAVVVSKSTIDSLLTLFNPPTPTVTETPGPPTTTPTVASTPTPPAATTVLPPTATPTSDQAATATPATGITATP